MSAPTIRRVVSLIGTARPSPTPATAVLMPTTRAAGVGERAAGVAGIERGVGLHDVLDDAAGGGRQRAAERRDDAGRHGAREAVRVADGDDELADLEAVGVAERRGRQVVGSDPKHGEVGQPIRADDVEVELATVDECRRSAVRSVDDVCGREHVAVRRHRDAAAAAAHTTAVEPAPDLEVGDGRRQRSSHLGHDARVRVERLLDVAARR